MAWAIPTLISIAWNIPWPCTPQCDFANRSLGYGPVVEGYSRRKATDGHINDGGIQRVVGFKEMVEVIANLFGSGAHCPQAPRNNRPYRAGVTPDIDPDLL